MSENEKIPILSLGLKVGDHLPTLSLVGYVLPDGQVEKSQRLPVFITPISGGYSLAKLNPKTEERPFIELTRTLNEPRARIYMAIIFWAFFDKLLGVLDNQQKTPVELECKNIFSFSAAFLIEHLGFKFDRIYVGVCFNKTAELVDYRQAFNKFELQARQDFFALAWK